MRVYEVLRNGLLEDKLIGKQPAFASNHLKKVNNAALAPLWWTCHMSMALNIIQAGHESCQHWIQPKILFSSAHYNLGPFELHISTGYTAYSTN